MLQNIAPAPFYANANVQPVEFTQAIFAASPRWIPIEIPIHDDSSVYTYQNDDLLRIWVGWSEEALRSLHGMLATHHWRAIATRDKSQPLPRQYESIVLELVSIIQNQLANRDNKNLNIQVVASSEEIEGALEGLSGLLKSVSLEHTETKTQLCLCDESLFDFAAASTLDYAWDNASLPLLKLQSGQWMEKIFDEIPTATRSDKIVFRDHGTYLITGGLGGLGKLFAKEIARAASRADIILSGRDQYNDDINRRLAESFGDDARVSYICLDLTNPEKIDETLQQALKTKKLDGVLHCAGMTKDAGIFNKSHAAVVDVLKPKVSGTWNIDQATRDHDLDFFVCFSSMASVMGNPGQTDYAAANGFMDWFSHHRDRLNEQLQRRGRSVVFNWSFWRESRILPSQDAQNLFKNAYGIEALESRTGMAFFYKCLGGTETQVMAVPGDLEKIRSFMKPTLGSAMFGVDAASHIGPRTEMSRDANTSKSRAIAQVFLSAC